MYPMYYVYMVYIYICILFFMVVVSRPLMTRGEMRELRLFSFSFLFFFFFHLTLCPYQINLSIHCNLKHTVPSVSKIVDHATPPETHTRNEVLTF
ncbi:hypothetical protein GGR50DRAFT_474846 [Xylaria sp. CBS 124048]|nr:hypothetical protein GGR50DRAFT_474846 [Xylaria sp. CBS 124048]